MKKRLLILMTVTGMIILLGGLLTYGLGVHEIIPVPRPDLIVGDKRNAENAQKHRVYAGFRRFLIPQPT
jgi:hypothetical protein